MNWNQVKLLLYLCKVDTHVHVASAMNQKHLLRFIKHKMKTNAGDLVCLDREGKAMTLEQVTFSNYIGTIFCRDVYLFRNHLIS